MTLFNVTNILEQIALLQKNVRTASDGSIYEFLDANPSVRYNVIHFSQTTHRTEDDFDYYGYNIFFVGRLEHNLEDNRLELQSEGKEVITNIIRTFCEKYDLEMPVLRFKPYTQRFVDECAGVYCTLELEVPVDWVCEETDGDFGFINPDSGDEEPKQAKTVTYNVNGNYRVIPDEGYGSLEYVNVNVNVPRTGHTDEELQDAYNDGVSDQKAKLTAITATTNGDYTSVDGYSTITVNVPQGQVEFHTQTIEITNNGIYTPASGYDGFSQVTVNVPQQGGFVSYITYWTNDGKVVVPDWDSNRHSYDPYGNELPFVSNVYDENGGKLTYNGILSKIGNSYFGYKETLTSVVLPEGLSVIEGFDFYGASNLHRVTLPSTLTIIGECSFYRTALMNVDIPSNVGLIGHYAFYNCPNLNTVTIHSRDGKMVIDRGAFQKCTRLNVINVYCSNVGLPSITKNVFDDVYSNGALHLPQSLQGSHLDNLSDWQTALGNGWMVVYDL